MKSKKIFLSIIGGKYKGKRLELPSKVTTRSTKSILREAFFNSVAFEIDGVEFIEVFGGSGSMGLEALSRGAKRAYFIERDRDAYEILSKNCKNIDPSSTYIIFGDSFLELNSLIDKTSKDLMLYFDPPFDIREGMDGIYDNLIELISQIDESRVKLIAIEYMSRRDMPEFIGRFKKVKDKKFGKSALSFYRVE